MLTVEILTHLSVENSKFSKAWFSIRRRTEFAEDLALNLDRVRSIKDRA